MNDLSVLKVCFCQSKQLTEVEMNATPTKKNFEGSCGGIEQYTAYCQVCCFKNSQLAVKYPIGWYSRKHFQEEIDIHMRLAHEHIVKAYGAFTNTYDSKLLAMELIDGTTFHQVPLLDLEDYFNQALSAVKYLHDLGIVHGDIKRCNILIEKATKRLCLADLGSAFYVEQIPFNKDIQLAMTAIENYPLDNNNVICEAIHLNHRCETYLPPDHMQHALWRTGFRNVKTFHRMLLAADLWSLGLSFFFEYVDHLHGKIPKDVQNVNELTEDDLTQTDFSLETAFYKQHKYLRATFAPDVELPTTLKIIFDLFLKDHYDDRML